LRQGKVDIVFILTLLIVCSVWNRLLYRIALTFRGSTAALIYDKALSRQAGYNELGAVTLMSLQNERIGETIVGPNYFDGLWYQQIIKLCELESDFSQMPENDLTIMGSRGIVISGGQKHRIVSKGFVCY
jgi:hypothetical protein